jgi:hypothetical protein
MWVFDPGDPTQAERELIFYYFAMLVIAALGCKEEKIVARGDTGGVTAVEVHEFLVEAAKSTPIYAVILSEMRMSEVLFLLQQAEEESNADKFVCALKFAALLITTNHATKYSYILAHFFKWWECSSKADKKVYHDLILTKVTKNGKRVYVDRFFEWLVKSMRGGGLGKFYRRGTDRKIVRDAVLMSKMRQFRSAVKREINTSNHDDDEGTFAYVGGVFCQSLVYFNEIGLWKKRDTSMLSLVSDALQVNPAMIDWFVTGERRMDTYISYRLKQKDLTDDEIAADAVLLRSIESTMTNKLAANTTNKSRCVSTTVDFVVKSYNGKELKEEYKLTKEKWNDREERQPIPYKPATAKKFEYATAICRMREVFIREDPTWTSVTLQSVSDAIDQSMTELHNSITDRMRSASEHPLLDLCIGMDAMRITRDVYNQTKYLKTVQNAAADNSNTTQPEAGAAAASNDLASIWGLY